MRLRLSHNPRGRSAASPFHSRAPRPKDLTTGKGLSVPEVPEGRVLCRCGAVVRVRKDGKPHAHRYGTAAMRTHVGPCPYAQPTGFDPRMCETHGEFPVQRGVRFACGCLIKKETP